MTDIHIPSCPTCGDPVTSGCYPAEGICAVADDKDDKPEPIEMPGCVVLTDEEWAAINPEEKR